MRERIAKNGAILTAIALQVAAGSNSWAGFSMVRELRAMKWHNLRLLIYICAGNSA
jgi:hypothetical protein